MSTYKSLIELVPVHLCWGNHHQPRHSGEKPGDHPSLHSFFHPFPLATYFQATSPASQSVRVTAHIQELVVYNCISDAKICPSHFLI